MVCGAAAHDAFLPVSALARVEGRGVDVDNQLRPGLPLHGGRPNFVPDVLADVDADADTTDFVNRADVAPSEVAFLVENAVVGQENLVVGVYQSPVIPDGGRVGDAGLTGFHIAQHHGDAARLGNHLLHGGDIGVNKGLLEEQVFGRVAGSGQFGEGHQVSPGIAGAAQILHHQGGVAGEVSDREIELRQRQSECAGHFSVQATSA